MNDDVGEGGLQVASRGGYLEAMLCPLARKFQGPEGSEESKWVVGFASLGRGLRSRLSRDKNQC